MSRNLSFISATRDAKVVDPVLPDQAGRMTQADPIMGAPASEDAVRSRAYQIFEARGRHDGAALNDWLAAESELKGGGSVQE